MCEARRVASLRSFSAPVEMLSSTRLLGRVAAHEDAQARFQLRLRHQVAIRARALLGRAQRHAARDDRDPVQRLRVAARSARPPRARPRGRRPAASPCGPAWPRADRRARSCRTPRRSRRAAMLSRPLRVADSAASLTRLARSAPENPGVFSAMCLQIHVGGQRLALGVDAQDRPRAASSGRSTRMRRSKRPGRSSAGSSTSGRLVAAMTTTRSVRSKPSISDSS